MNVNGQAALDRGRAPVPGPSRSSSFPNFEVEELESGARLWTLDVQGCGLVTAVLLMPGGSELDIPERAGLASFTAGLRGAGTRDRDALEFAAAAEDLGTAISTSCGWENAAVATTIGAEDVAAGLELVAEAAGEPAFLDEEVERRRRRRLAEIERRRSDPSAQARAAFARAIYGDTPYAYPAIGDRRTTQEITREDIAGFHARALAAGSCHLIAVGELGHGRVRRAIEETVEPRLLPHARRFEAAARNLEPAPSSPPARRVVVVDRPGAAQTELRIGHSGVPKRHPDRVRLQVANSILGGKFMSRLNLTLREKHGYTYGVSSAFDFRRGPGPFVISTAVANDVAGAACRKTIEEVERMCDEPPGATELDDARNYMVGVFPYTLQTIQGLSSRLQTLAVFDLDHDEYDRWPEQVRATSDQDVLEVCLRHLSPEGLTIIAVGPADELLPQLEGLGTTEVQAAG